MVLFNRTVFTDLDDVNSESKLDRMEIAIEPQLDDNKVMFWGNTTGYSVSSQQLSGTITKDTLNIFSHSQCVCSWCSIQLTVQWL